jgi:hypothetical protein
MENPFTAEEVCDIAHNYSSSLLYNQPERERAKRRDRSPTEATCSSEHRAAIYHNG